MKQINLPIVILVNKVIFISTAPSAKSSLTLLKYVVLPSWKLLHNISIARNNYLGRGDSYLSSYYIVLTWETIIMFEPEKTSIIFSLLYLKKNK